MVDNPKKINAARLSMATAAGLAALKLSAGLLTGSIAVLSSAIDSVLDILMSGVNYMAIREAAQPADEKHPFGHGKFETIATLIQSLFIAISGGWIIYESSRRLIEGVAPSQLGDGIIVLGISVVASLWISRYLKRVAKETDSSALQADSLHFAMDVYTNLALLAGLTIMAFFDVPWLDPVLSFLVALYILVEAMRLIRHGLRDALDEGLPDSIREKITQLIESRQEELLDFHRLRTRRAGSQKIIDFHLTVCRHLTVGEGHTIADNVERLIEEQITGSDVTIHVEPCMDENCLGMDKCPKLKARARQGNS